MTEFDSIYAKYAAAVFRYSLKCVGQRDVAEDITSEVFLALYRHLREIDIGRLPGWLFAVAKTERSTTGAAATSSNGIFRRCRQRNQRGSRRLKAGSATRERSNPCIGRA